jgi:branched-chain amino acid aminotransferase
MIKGEYIVLNNEVVKPIVIESKGSVVYEVLRMIDGVPLFYDDHFDRLFHSCELIKQSVGVHSAVLLSQLAILSLKNGFTNGNVMLKIIFHEDQRNMLIHFIPHTYPSENDYRVGVEVGFLEAERINPEAKVLQAAIRERANQQIAETGVYELMLVDHNNTITEGSRSNFFFIKKNTLYTAPLFKVLKGVTLSKVLDIAVDYGIPIHFTSIEMNELSTYEAMFITGTSPQILPVAKAGKYTFDVHHPLIHTISDAFQKLVDKDIDEKRQVLVNAKD